jgi:Type I restriction-modification system methyltransferase subunit
MTHGAHIRAICKLLRGFAYRHDLHRLFSDCMEATAIAISNSVDLANRERREARYLEIIGPYGREVIDAFPKVLGETVLAFEAEPSDVLGAVYAELELGSKDRGQYFTPYPVAQLMAGVIIGSRESVEEIIKRNGFVRAMEPACGAGAMVIALAETMREEGINYQQHLHVTAVDIDPRAVHMAYIQFALLHIPAAVVHGNSLSMEMRECWYTPAHILGGWSTKLARRDVEDAAHALLAAPTRASMQISEPVSAPANNSPQQLSLF